MVALAFFGRLHRPLRLRLLLLLLLWPLRHVWCELDALALPPPTPHPCRAPPLPRPLPRPTLRAPLAPLSRPSRAGFLQTSYFFGYMLLASYAAFIMLGTIGFASSLLFVRRIYRAVKCD